MTIVAFCERLGIRVRRGTGGAPWAPRRRVQARPRRKTPSRRTPRPSPRRGTPGAIASWRRLKRVGIDDIDAGEVSDSTMYRALRRNGLCLPAGYTDEVRQLTDVRREAFITSPTRRNRL